MKLGDNFGMVFDRRVGTVFAVKGLGIMGSTVPRSTDPTLLGLTASDDVYILDLTGKSRHTPIFSL